MPKEIIAQERFRAIRDLWVVAVVFVAAFAISVWIDRFATLTAISTAHPQWHIDDIVAAMTASFIAVGWYAWRRWRSIRRKADALLELVHEIKMRNAEIERANRDLAIAREAAEAASRTKSQFLAAMSHELRTPLNAIIGFSSLIREDNSGPAGNAVHREYADDIHKSGEGLLAIVSGILDMSKLATDEFVLVDDQVDVASMIRATIRSFEAQAAEADLTLSVNLPTNLPVLRADEQRVKQILLNLLSNAAKFTKPHGMVTIDAMRCTDGSLAIGVADTGIGMDEQQIATALEPFRQVDNALSRKFDGVGIGLALAQQLIKRHGGRLEIASTLGVGTSVTVIFPPTRVQLLRPPMET